MTLNFDKHRDHLEQDIREELQSIYIDKFKILDIKENVLLVGPMVLIQLLKAQLFHIKLPGLGIIMANNRNMVNAI